MDDTKLLDGGLVLVVDDQATNRDLVGELLEADGFRVDCVASGPQALEYQARRPADCVILDVMMPNMDGFATCRVLKADPKTRHVPVLMLTALVDIEDKLRALKVGADDFLPKPVDRIELVARVRSLVRIKRLHDDLDTAEEIMVAMARVLENKHPRGANHGERVALMAVRLALALDLPAATAHHLGLAGQLHDLGKLGVPEVLLTEETERARWAPEEERLFRRHAEIGERILSPLHSFAPVRRLVRGHHERLDGSGWPDGLAGDRFDRALECLALANAHADLVARGSREQAAADLRAAAERGQFRRDSVELLLRLDDHPVTGSWRSQLPLLPQARPGRVLVADDDPQNRELVADMLEAAGHEVITAEHGAAVLTAVQRERPELVVCDVRMPYLSGFSVCRALKADPRTEFLPLILVTASRGGEDRREGLAAGADDFLLVPVNENELTTRVSSLLRMRQHYLDLEDHQNVILSLASALEAKDPDTAGHSERVGHVAADLARHLGQDEAFCERLRVAGLVHDIGIVGVSQKVLAKSAALDPAERALVASHPSRGESICRPLRTLAAVLPFIKHHHERFDGSGYPDGLRGELIPLGARLLGLADAYDALTSNRPYRPRLDARAALALLQQETTRGKWDPRHTAALAALVAAWEREAER